MSKDQIIRATAGAGKTTGLLEEVYEAYRSHWVSQGRLPRILLSTFTVKAANELYERLVQKAIDLQDHDFLNYVSSNFLEVGTLHSVFLKIYDQISSEETAGDQAYTSNAVRNKLGRAILHEVIKEFNVEHVFTEAKVEKEVLEIFNHIYSNSDGEASTVSYELLIDTVEVSLKELLTQFDNVDLYEAWEKTKSFKSLISYIEGMAPKEQKKLKALKVFLQDETNSEDFLKRYSEKHEIYSRLYYEWSKRFFEQTSKSELSDISEIEIQVYKKLKKNPKVEKIWDFCFFDEYQDTSPIQKKIIDILAAPSQKYFVGDPYQSIYFFRGARKEIFLEEFKSIENSGGEADYRLNNYRSAPQIVNFANGLTKFMLPDFIEMDPYIEDRVGVVEVHHFPEGGIQDEILYVTNCIRKIDLTKESVAILARGSKELLLCGKELRKAGSPYKLSLSKGFESSLEVLEMVSFLKFLNDPHDDQNLLILLMSKWCKLPDADIKKAIENLENEEIKSVWEQVEHFEGLKVLRDSLGMMEFLSRAVILSDFMNNTGFLNYTDELDSTGERESNIMKLVSALESEEVKRNFGLLEFCDDILSGNYRFESEEVKSDSGCLLMTVHGSKGLQFDHVFLIGLNKSNVSRAKSFYFDLETALFSLKEYSFSEGKGRFPFYIEKLSLDEKSEMDAESRRLFYVAMTRAKTSLSLLGSKKISKTSKSPSWLSLTMDHCRKTGKEELCFEHEGGEEKALEIEEESYSLEKAFQKYQGGTKFLEPASIAVTGANQNKEYDTEEENLFRMSNAIREGTLFHELMERSDNLECALGEVEKVFKNDIEKHKAAVQYLFEQADFPFTQILENAEKEWGFDFSNEDLSVSGKIDLWAKMGDTVWVLDYKTGQVGSLDKGFAQLRKYKEVLEDYLNDSTLTYNLVLTFPYDEKTLIEANI